MKRALTVSIGALALAGMTLPSSAADLGARPIMKAPVAAPPVAFSWTSCYIGANAGGKWGRFRGFETIGPFDGFAGPSTLVFPGVVANDDFDSGFLAGGQIGCQWQTGAWVFGLEGDFDATRIRETFIAPAGTLAPFFPGDSIFLRNRWQASVRGRLGYAFDRWLVYATGGVAFADVRATVGFAPVPFAAPTLFLEDSQTLIGGTVGGGVDYAITNNLSLGVEYRFSRFGHENFALGTVTGGGFGAFA